MLYDEWREVGIRGLVRVHLHVVDVRPVGLLGSPDKRHYLSLGVYGCGEADLEEEHLVEGLTDAKAIRMAIARFDSACHKAMVVTTRQEDAGRPEVDVDKTFRELSG